MKTPINWMTALSIKKPTRKRIVVYPNLHYMLYGGSWTDNFINKKKK